MFSTKLFLKNKKPLPKERGLTQTNITNKA
jgi:hypothetical protein